MISKLAVIQYLIHRVLWEEALTEEGGPVQFGGDKVMFSCSDA